MRVAPWDGGRRNVRGKVICIQDPCQAFWNIGAETFVMEICKSTLCLFTCMISLIETKLNSSRWSRLMLGSQIYSELLRIFASLTILDSAGQLVWAPQLYIFAWQELAEKARDVFACIAQAFCKKVGVGSKWSNRCIEVALGYLLEA